MTGMLASVNSLEEALQVLDMDADIIDLKAPESGALGALGTDSVKQISRTIDGQRPLSATIGDLPMDPESVLGATLRMAATGVDYVKIGFFPGGQWQDTVHALSQPAIDNARLIAVLFADQSPDLTWIPRLAEAGFTGVMLDTCDKDFGSLRSICRDEFLASFVSLCRSHGLLCGLAGSLRADDIQPLLLLKPDYLGFRGALCCGQQRTDRLDPAAVRAIRASIPFCVRKLAPQFVNNGRERLSGT